MKIKLSRLLITFYCFVVIVIVVLVLTTCPPFLVSSVPKKRNTCQDKHGPVKCSSGRDFEEQPADYKSVEEDREIFNKLFHKFFIHCFVEVVFALRSRPSRAYLSRQPIGLRLF